MSTSWPPFAVLLLRLTILASGSGAPNPKRASRCLTAYTDVNVATMICQGDHRPERGKQQA